MRSLPLVASVLGQKYGVKVEIGGQVACTDGNTIHLPTLPLEADDILLKLVRSFTDHESAHIRHTDFELLKDPDLSPLIKHVFNIFEDWRVEHQLSKIFPGCRSNFNWLIDYHFAPTKRIKKGSAELILNYFFYAVRAWDVSSVARNRDRMANQMAKHYPTLFGEITALLNKLKVNCYSSKDALDYAKKVADLIKDEINELHNPPPKPNDSTTSELVENQQKAKQLENLLGACSNELPDNIGETLAKELESKAPVQGEGLSVAVIGKKKFQALDQNEIAEVKRASAALHTRLHSLLQSSVLQRRQVGRRGKLDTSKLYKISHDPKIFLRDAERQGMCTAVHILLDCSSSMRLRMELASNACFAVADSLSKINGINVAVTAFPAGSLYSTSQPSGNFCTVAPILKHGQKMHSNFKLTPSGLTPMGETIFWTMQQMYRLKETRKLILILTDGKPDSLEVAQTAIEHGQKLGYEFYGIGIHDDNIKHLLPKSSKIINQLSDLAPAMFKLLQNALIN